MTVSRTPRSSVTSAKSSPKSAKSTPRSVKSAKSTRSKKSTPLKQVSTPVKSIKSTPAKTSPYFARTSGKGKGKATQSSSRRTSRASKKAEPESDAEEMDEDDEDEDDKADVTGMTETSSSSEEEIDTEDAFDPSSDEEAPDEDEEMESDIDSDYLDDDNYGGSKRKVKPSPKTKAGRSSLGGQKSKGKGKTRVEGYEDEDEADMDDIELEEGQEIAGRIYPAPTTGRVPPGQISRNTFNFLKNLQIPERNDRDWFRSHEPAFRLAEKEWKDFVGQVQFKFHEADDQVPILPPKDIIHRIYRDVRFSSDKTPYKKSFSLSTSRGGRKGIWAGYYFAISPNENSLIASGVWMPGKDELATIRHNFLTDPDRFRRVIAEPRFVELFGPAKPHPKGKRQNVFGHDDALKVAPKGVEKTHKDIDILKLRSIAVVHHFSDEEVLQKDFQDRVKEVVEVMRPLVHLLNDLMTLPGDTNGDQDGDESGDESD